MRPHRSIIFVCIATAALVLPPGGVFAQLCPELVQVGAQLTALDAEIALINDMNTLQLSREQIGSLTPLVEELRATAVAGEQERVALLNQLLPLLTQKRDLALRDEQASEEIEGQIAEINNRLIEMDTRLSETLLPFATRLREVLNDPQIAIITGEEDARRQVLDLVDWVRGLDDAAFEQEVPPLAVELADPELGLAEDEVIDLLSLARAMSEEQYQRAGEEIRGRLIELYRPTHEAADRILVQVFLHEAMPRVLAGKLAAMPAE